MSEYILHCPEDEDYKPDPRGMGILFLEKMKFYKDKIAQIDGESGETQTFGDILIRSIRVAQHLKSKGVTPNDVITLCSANSFDVCLPYLAALFLRVKFSSLDPSLSLQDCTHLVNIVKPKLIFCDKESLNLMVETVKKANLDSEIIVFDDDTEYTSFSEFLVPTESEEEFEAEPLEDINETAVIFFSSGTTGLPKGVCTTHYGLLSKMKIPKDEEAIVSYTYLLFTTFYWISAISFFNACVVTGSPRIICNDFTAEKFLNIVEKRKVNVTFLTPIQINQILAHPKASEFDLSSLRACIAGGSFIKEEQLRAFQKLLPLGLVGNGYGITETQGMVTYFSFPEDLALMITKISSVGKPFQGCSYKIVDHETEEIVGPNVQGEIRIKSKALMVGYYNNPEATAAAFDEDGYYCTGDIGYYDEDECFYVVDRIKEMFKYQSWHILPAELEAILLTHPDVMESAVIGQPHEIDGDHPMAIIVLKPGSTTTETDILNFFNDQVSDRKKLRAGVKFVDSLPHTPSGKINRRNLKQMFINK